MAGETKIYRAPGLTGRIVMLRDYWKKAEAAMKWLIPFFVAVFLLFGCRPANQTTPGAAAKSASAAAENTDAGERAADAGERGSGSVKQQAQESQAETQQPDTQEALAETQRPETQDARDETPLQDSTEAPAEPTAPDTAQNEADFGAEASQPGEFGPEEADGGRLSVSEDGHYTTKEEVALYLHTYGQLPENFITKKEAEAAGWVSREGNLWDVAPGMSIGGSRFGNYEGLLPDQKGRVWFECDIDFDGTYRGAKRIVFSNDGLIYYTEDHYKSFEKLY